MVRRRRECALYRRVWKSVAAGLVAAAFLSVCATGTSARMGTPSDPADRIRAPTPRCVVGLSLAAADSVVDPYRRARALERIAQAQSHTRAIGEALESLSRSLTAAAGITRSAYIGEIGIAALANVEAAQGQSPCTVEYCKDLREDSARRTKRKRRWSAPRTSPSTSGLTATVRTASSASRRLSWCSGPWMRRAQRSREPTFPEIPSTSLSLHKTVRKQAETGDVTGALLTAGAMPRGNERARSLARIAAVQANAGNMAGALVTAGIIQQSYFRMLAMHYIGSARARNGDIDGAWRAVEEIGAIWHNARDGFAGSRDTVILQADTIVVIADAHLTRGEFEKALAATKGMSDDFAFGRTRAAIARAQTAAGDLDAARVTAKATCGGRRHDSRCVEVLAGLAIAMMTTSVRKVDAQDVLSWPGARPSALSCRTIARVRSASSIRPVCGWGIAGVRAWRSCRHPRPRTRSPMRGNVLQRLPKSGSRPPASGTSTARRKLYSASLAATSKLDVFG